MHYFQSPFKQCAVVITKKFGLDFAKIFRFRFREFVYFTNVIGIDYIHEWLIFFLICYCAKINTSFQHIWFILLDNECNLLPRFFPGHTSKVRRSSASKLLFVFLTIEKTNNYVALKGWDKNLIAVFIGVWKSWKSLCSRSMLKSLHDLFRLD